MRIRYIFNVLTRLTPEGEWFPLGAHEADAGTLYGAAEQIRHELEEQTSRTLPSVLLRLDLVAAIGLTGR